MTPITPIRRCFACRRTAPRSEFLRIVRQHDTREIFIGHGMGRSAYLCPTKSCIERTRKKNRLQQALRTPISVDLYDRLLDTIEEAGEPSANAARLVNGQ